MTDDRGTPLGRLYLDYIDLLAENSRLREELTKDMRLIIGIYESLGGEDKDELAALRGRLWGAAVTMGRMASIATEERAWSDPPPQSRPRVSLGPIPLPSPGDA